MSSAFAPVVAVTMVAVVLGTYLNGILVLLPSQQRLTARSYIEQEQANTAARDSPVPRPDRYDDRGPAAFRTSCDWHDRTPVHRLEHPHRHRDHRACHRLEGRPDQRHRASMGRGELTPDWASVRDRWHRLQALRTAGLAVALALQMIAAQPLLC